MSFNKSNPVKGCSSLCTRGVFKKATCSGSRGIDYE
jgi:hypothetical protein